MRSLFFSVLLLAATTAGAADGLVLSDAWVRAVPPVSKTTAGYFTLRNTGDQPLHITGVTAAGAASAELHDMSADEQGVRRMRHLETVEVPAGGQVEFATGGRHLMLFGLAGAPAPGSTVEICLEFDDESSLCHPFPVLKTQP